MFVPAFTKPNAKARSLRGNHSEIVFVEAGKFGDSATPRKMRANLKPKALPANAWDMDAMHQRISAMANPARTPMIARRRPQTNRPHAHAIANALWKLPY